VYFYKCLFLAEVLDLLGIVLKTDLSFQQVFGALMEYGVILLLLKKRLKPTYSISFGLKKMFPNGDSQPPAARHLPAGGQSQAQVKRRRTPGSPAGNAATMLGVGEIEEQKPMVTNACLHVGGLTLFGCFRENFIALKKYQFAHLTVVTNCEII
jgi:hypothetical protein